MEKLSITLTAAQKAFIDAEVASGRYASASEVLRQSINKRMEEQAFLDLLIERHDAATRAHEEGTLIPADEVFADVRARFKNAA